MLQGHGKCLVSEQFLVKVSKNYAQYRLQCNSHLQEETLKDESMESGIRPINV